MCVVPSTTLSTKRFVGSWRQSVFCYSGKHRTSRFLKVKEKIQIGNRRPGVHNTKETLASGFPEYPKDRAGLAGDAHKLSWPTRLRIRLTPAYIRRSTGCVLKREYQFSTNARIQKIFFVLFCFLLGHSRRLPSGVYLLSHRLLFLPADDHR